MCNSRSPDFRVAAAYLVGLFALDFLWSVIWRYVGEWRTKDETRIKNMERILNRGIVLDVLFGIAFGALFAFRGRLSDMWFVCAYIAGYAVYIALTFGLKTLNIEIF